MALRIGNEKAPTRRLGHQIVNYKSLNNLGMSYERIYRDMFLLLSDISIFCGLLNIFFEDTTPTDRI